MNKLRSGTKVLLNLLILSACFIHELNSFEYMLENMRKV